MVTNYFKTLKYSTSAIPGFYIVESGGDQYYVCAYSNRDKGKTEIINTLKTLPGYGSLTAGDFDFHHIVEEQHLADISFSHHLYFNYANMPTVMIHKGEHKRYNAILHTRETRFLYLRDQENFTGKNASAVMRKQAAIQLFNNGEDSDGGKEISNRLTILKEIYSSVYEGNRVLKTIANNIFNEYRHQLRF